MGSSMGGLVSAYAVSEYPDVFGGAGCLSTHWPIGDGVVVKYLIDRLPDPKSHKLYFDYGTEGLDASYEPYQKELDIALRQKGYQAGKNWITRKFEGADHGEAYWRLRVDIPLTLFLTDMGTPQQPGGAGKSVAFKVPANIAWWDTGLDVGAGQVLIFSATGTVNTYGGAPESDSPPGGQSTLCQPFDADSECLLNGAPYGALIGKIGSDKPFLIGSNLTITVKSGGRLYLSVNDNLGNTRDLFADNSGLFDVMIVIK